MKPSIATAILLFEAGDLQSDQVVAMFREIINSGDIWKLPSHYLDAAALLMDSGYILNTKDDNHVN